MKTSPARVALRALDATMALQRIDQMRASIETLPDEMVLSVLRRWLDEGVVEERPGDFAPVLPWHVASHPHHTSLVASHEPPVLRRKWHG